MLKAEFFDAGSANWTNLVDEISPQSAKKKKIFEFSVQPRDDEVLDKHEKFIRTNGSDIEILLCYP